MGYYVTLTGAEWIVPETEEVLNALREMPTKYHGLKRGGSSNGDSWFSWMSDEEIKTAHTAEGIFTSLGFETMGTDGGFELIGYNSKTGQEDLFLAVVARFCADGSYINWRGEDGEVLRNEVQGGRMFVQQGVIAWTDSRPYKPSRYISGTDKDGKFFFTEETFDGLDDPKLIGLENNRDKNKKVDA